MQEHDLKKLYAQWRAGPGSDRAAPHADDASDVSERIARWSLESRDDESGDERLLELARTPGALAAYRVARELAPNASGLARALGNGGVRSVSSGQRVRPAVWASAAAAALLLFVVNGVERRQERASAVARHDVINAASFEGENAHSAPRSETLFRSDFDEG